MSVRFVRRLFLSPENHVRFAQSCPVPSITAARSSNSYTWKASQPVSRPPRFAIYAGIAVLGLAIALFATTRLSGALPIFTPAVQGVGAGESAGPPAPDASGLATRPDSSVATVTFRPTSVPLSGDEIANPMRGSYKSSGVPMSPPGWPYVDSYVRYPWRVLEPSEGVYDFSAIEADLANASAHGGKLGIRLVAANSYDGGSSVPDYLMQQMAHGGWFTYPGTNKSVYAPDWNDPAFLNRAQALLDALSKQFADDPRLGFVDIGLYGDFGEWHLYNYPQWNTPMTLPNKQALVDMQVHAFPNTQLVMMVDDADALRYALSLSPAIGWRGDCLGTKHFDSIQSGSAWDLAKDRWKTAPVITEYCDPPRLDLAEQQVQSYHVSMIRNGNLPTWDSFSQAQQGQFDDENKLAGYRLVLDSVSLPESIARGAAFTVTSSWSNVGVAPDYLPENVVLQLRDPSSGRIVWQGLSNIQLKSLLPTTDYSTGKDTPAQTSDGWTLPQDVAPGEYQLEVTVLDPSGYYQPLDLAIQGRAADGSYPLGKVQVN